MTSQNYRDLQYVLKHYLELTVKNKNQPIRKLAQHLADIAERELLKL